MKITVIILTFNEEKHLKRCIESLSILNADIYVIDSYSTDQTVNIAHSLGVNVLKNEWVNHSVQFNWALSQLKNNPDWILRIDADEILTLELANEIKISLPLIKKDIDGIFFPRWMIFQGRLIKYGGVFPVHILRMFRYGRGVCESRWMDEHILVKGKTINFSNALIDNNLNPLSWWITKHNSYSSKESLEILNAEFSFISPDVANSLESRGLIYLNKKRVYSFLPNGFRAFIYFIYRYFIRLGFLDGKEGFAFHFFQGFWYRFLVDYKVAEVKKYMTKHNVEVVDAIKKILEINLHH